MKRLFVDANVFLRVLADDDAGQSRKARELFADAFAGRVELVTGPPVLFEVAWTLRSRYRKSATDVLDVMEAVLGTPGLETADAGRVREAIDLARKGDGDFADAYVAAMGMATACEGIATFNTRDFARMGMGTWP
jgi:predicted nucleic-acid-binding protein